MTTGGPSPEEVRDLVSRIVDGILSPAAPASPPNAGTAATAAGEGPVPAASETAAPGAESGEQASVAIGADHGGYPLKERLAFKLKEAGHVVVDCGTNSVDPVDYPDYAYAVASKVADGSCTYGIMIDGAGIGSAMVANKVPGVRAALCYDLSTARNSREHNHANVLTLGAGMVGDALAWQIVQEWLAVPWATGRHARRVEKIMAIEKRGTHDGA